MTDERYNPQDAWDPMHEPGTTDLHWSTDNVGEAAPGVLTPLTGPIWARVGCEMTARIAHALGATSKAEWQNPSPDPLVTLYFGRLTMQIEYMALLGDRVPGTTGQDSVTSMFGRIPETMTFQPTKRRYPFIAARMPALALRTPGQVRKLAPQVDAWWREQVPLFDSFDLPTAIRTFALGHQRFDSTITLHSTALLSAVQPMLDAVTKVADQSGVAEVGQLSGTGGAEMAIIEDIWRASRGQLTVEQVVANHGFHGPFEGELESRVWREEPAPLERIVREYAARDESESPVLRDERARERLPALQREVAAQFPSIQRPAITALLKRAAKLIPLRGVGKRSFLQCYDVARGSARRAGELLAEQGVLDEPGDVFYLTPDELEGTIPADAKELVAKRRERRETYQRLRLPGGWQGVPTVTRVDEDQEPSGERPDVVTGIGVSAGVAEGVVRVVLDPSFAEVEPGEVLVTPTTDPSWASIMFISSALVVDIGGALSHAAVVARELGVPCVVNTRTGTQDLRTGDRVRVDGKAGTVEVLDRETSSVGPHQPSEEA